MATAIRRPWRHSLVEGITYPRVGDGHSGTIYLQRSPLLSVTHLLWGSVSCSFGVCAEHMACYRKHRVTTNVSQTAPSTNVCAIGHAVGCERSSGMFVLCCCLSFENYEDNVHLYWSFPPWLTPRPRAPRGRLRSLSPTAFVGHTPWRICCCNSPHVLDKH